MKYNLIVLWTHTHIHFTHTDTKGREIAGLHLESQHVIRDIDGSLDGRAQATQLQANGTEQVFR